MEHVVDKVSDITAQDVADYLRLTEVDEGDENTLNTMIKVAKTYIKQYTGRSEAELDNYSDFVIVLLILCQDMWDNRVLYINTGNVNKVVDSILGLHSVNLL